MITTIWTITTRVAGSADYLFELGDHTFSFTLKEQAVNAYNAIIEYWKEVETIEDHVFMTEGLLYDQQMYMNWKQKKE